MLAAVVVAGGLDVVGSGWWVVVESCSRRGHSRPTRRGEVKWPAVASGTPQATRTPERLHLRLPVQR